MHATSSLEQAEGRTATAPLERLGHWCGNALAPIVATISSVRRARMFHPDGLVYRASVESAAEARDLELLAARLSGPAFVRLSSAWWRGAKEWPDVLGLAIRFTRANAASNGRPQAGDQDLLFATIRFPWTTPLAALTTHVSSFLWNHYHAVSPFEVDGVGRVKFRLRSPRLSNDLGASRAQHLAQQVASGSAVYELSLRRLELPTRRRRWEPLARVVLEQPMAIDQAALRFSPFVDGRGIRPVGFVHALRLGTYRASQQARPASQRQAAARS